MATKADDEWTEIGDGSHAQRRGSVETVRGEDGRKKEALHASL